MAKAAWCAECGDWAYVRSDGCCVAGHPASSLRGHYETPDVPGPAVGAPTVDLPQFGVGDMPAEVARFNWGAFCLTGIWGIAHGAWPLVGLWVAALVVPFALSFSVGVAVGALGMQFTLSMVIGLAVLGEAFVLAVRLWAALNADRLAWTNDARRFAAGQRTSPRSSVPKYIADQRTWGRAGLFILAVITPFMTVNTYLAMDAQWNAGPLGVALSGGLIALEVFIGYMVQRTRKEA
ncbi:MAG: hypothetical protein ACYC77_03680 [Coriobacteriia bacterium]